MEVVIVVMRLVWGTGRWEVTKEGKSVWVSLENQQKKRGSSVALCICGR